MKILFAFVPMTLLTLLSPAQAQTNGPLNDSHLAKTGEDAGLGEDAALSRNTAKTPGIQRFMWSDGSHEISLLIFSRPDPRQLGKLQIIRESLQQNFLQTDPTVGDSQIAAINQSPNATVVLQPETYDLLQRSLNIAKRSRGAFDPSLFSLRQVWGFYDHGRIPSPLALEIALAQVSYTAMHLDAKDQSLKRSAPVLLDLSPVSDGRNLDLAAQEVKKYLGKNFVLRIDNQVFVSGQKGAEPWMIGIEDPRSTSHFAAISSTVLDSPQLAIASLSDSQQFFFASGSRYHEILDPRSGQPASLSRSVTVLGPRADMAAGLAYAAFVLGAKKGLNLIETSPGYAAIVVDADNRVWLSSKLQGKVAYRPPTDKP